MQDGSVVAGTIVAVGAGLAAGTGAAILIKAIPLRAIPSRTAPSSTAPSSAAPPSAAPLSARAGDHLGGADLRAGPGGRFGAARDWLSAEDWLNAGVWFRTRGWRRPEGIAAIGLTAVIFAAWWLRFGLSPMLPALCYLTIVAVALAFIDARHRRLPDLLTLPSYPVTLVLLGIAAAVQPGGGASFLHALAGLAAALLLFFFQALIYPAGIGWGDVKLSGLLGLYLGWFGWRALLAGLFCGYLLAAVYGAGLLLAGRATRKSMLPFGPFLLAGTVTILVIAGHSAG